MRRRIAQGLAIALLVSFGAAQGPTNSWSANYKAAEAVAVAYPATRPHAHPYQVGTASWYGEYFDGKPTASGEPYDMYQFTAAHRELPMGSWLKVTNMRTGKWLIVRVNDRGPFVGDRILDLSDSAAEMLDIKARGVARVKLEVVDEPAIVASATSVALE